MVHHSKYFLHYKMVKFISTGDPGLLFGGGGQSYTSCQKSLQRPHIVKDILVGMWVVEVRSCRVI